MVRFLIVCAACALLLPACSDSLDGDPPTDTQAFDLRVGEVTDLSLEANPSTGFAWVVVSGTGDVIIQRGDPVFLPGGDEDVVGAPGLTVFEFEAVGEGTTTLVLHYVREWEDEPPTEVHEVTLKVGPAN
jgi:predicted secreted protein